MKKIFVFAVLSLVASTGIAQDRETVFVKNEEDFKNAASGTVLRGSIRKGEEWTQQELIAKYCDLKTFTVWDVFNRNQWICEKA